MHDVVIMAQFIRSSTDRQTKPERFHNAWKVVGPVQDDVWVDEGWSIRLNCMIWMLLLLVTYAELTLPRART